ncbi:MAG TPA: folate-binding protein [Mycobacteriales bacterium]|nr:folate-binding protein [Mycobacteriales bacterium]
MTSPLLSHVPGAVEGEGPDAGVAYHYGDPLGEQRRAETGAGLVDRSHRGVLRVGGRERLSWLHSLTSQHLEALPPWRGTMALVLSPHGHVEHHLMVADDGDATWLDVEPGTAEALMAFLAKMVFLLYVDPQDVTSSYAVLSLVGPAAAEVLGSAGAAVGGGAYDVTAAPWGGLVRRVDAPLADGADLLVPRDRLAEVWDALAAAGASPLGTWGLEALRAAARVPRLGHESDHRTIPHEVGWLATAVHLQKGCYRGQETVARVQNLGRPPRRLVLGHLDGSVDTLPAHGDPVEWDGTPVGFVTTAARHHELGPIALALVKRSVPDDADLIASGIPLRIDPTARPPKS